MSNPFEPINARLTNLEVLTHEVLQILRSMPPTGSANEKPVNVKGCAEILNVAEQTVYQNIGRIPHRKRHGRLYFFPSELREYLQKGPDA